jgi:hypothetical protein
MDSIQTDEARLNMVLQKYQDLKEKQRKEKEDLLKEEQFKKDRQIVKENGEQKICPYKEYKKGILRFLFANADEQPILFRQLLYKQLIDRKEFFSTVNPELKDMTDRLNDDIFNSKLREISCQTEILKTQMLNHKNGIKQTGLLSIIERKIYIAELQIDIGIHNLMNNKSVKFYFQT